MNAKTDLMLLTWFITYFWAHFAITWFLVCLASGAFVWWMPVFPAFTAVRAVRQHMCRCFASEALFLLGAILVSLFFAERVHDPVLIPRLFSERCLARTPGPTHIIIGMVCRMPLCCTLALLVSTSPKRYSERSNFIIFGLIRNLLKSICCRLKVRWDCASNVWHNLCNTTKKITVPFKSDFACTITCYSWYVVLYR